jgi:hypothetical protein
MAGATGSIPVVPTTDSALSASACPRPRPGGFSPNLLVTIQMLLKGWRLALCLCRTAAAETLIPMTRHSTMWSAPALLALVISSGTAQAQGATSAATAAAAVPVQPSVSSERDVAAAAVKVAVVAHDFDKAINIDVSWKENHPDDVDFVYSLPLLYRLAGHPDMADAARNDLLARWAAIRDHASRPQHAGMLVDGFAVGQDRVVATQCFEKSGRFGVSWRFDVVGGEGTPALLGFFTVESPLSDNQMAKELGQPTPVYTLDHFLPGRHETVALLSSGSTPVYDDLRRRVSAYMGDPRPVTSFGSGSGPLSHEGCGFDG